MRILYPYFQLTILKEVREVLYCNDGGDENVFDRWREEA